VNHSANSRVLLLGLFVIAWCGVIFGCTSNPYLKTYKYRSIEDERTLLAKSWPKEAEEVFAAKQDLRADPRKPEAMLQLARTYADIAEHVGDPKDPMHEYCLEAAGYELKLYKARGGPFTPAVIAETGRNLYLRDRDCQAPRWIAKAIQMDAALAADYGDVLKRSKSECQEATK